MPKTRFKPVTLKHHNYWLQRWDDYLLSLPNQEQRLLGLIVPTESDLQHFTTIHDLDMNTRQTLYKLLESELYD